MELGKGLGHQDRLRELEGLSVVKRVLRGTFLLSQLPDRRM